MPRFQEWKAAPEAARMALSRELLRDNAHIAAYHFHKRYTLLRTIVLKQKFNLTDFWGRYEWQGRGSSHHHGLYWLNGHPDLDPDNGQSREQFARIWGYHVSAVNPEPQRVQAPGEGNPLINNLLEHPLSIQFLSMVVNRVQRHRCNNYCMQLNKHTKQVECRFGFPHAQRLLASLEKVPHSKHWSFRGERNDGQINHYNRLLTIAWLANTDVSPCTSLQQVIDYAAKYCSKSEKKSESFAQIGKALMPRVKDHNPLVSFTSKLLNQLVAERDYSKQEVSHLLLAHAQRLLASLEKVPHSKHWSFRGERNDGQINHYNRLLTVAWLANTDVSPCTSLQQVIDYAAKYCSKSEKKSESFAQIGKALMSRVKDHNPLVSFTSKLLNQLVAERDYSKQEVSHLLLGLPLQEGSRTCLYVDCRHPDRHSRSLRIDGDEVDEAPNAYEKYCRRPEALEDLTYVSFLKYWNFRSRDPSTWKQWQPSNVNGRPRVLVYSPRYQADPEGQQWADYCRVKLTLNHTHRRLDELLAFGGQRFNSHAKAFSYCWQHHSHGDDHYGRPKEARLQPQEDHYEALPVEEEFDDEDWIRLAALLPDKPLTQQGLDLLGRRDIDVNYDWTRHVGTYPEFRDSYWKDLIASHPIANDVEELGPHWRDQLNPEQRLVYDTFMGHSQAQNPAQILLHVDGGGGTGKSFLIKVLSSHLQAAALPNPSPICRVAPTGVASNQIQGSTIHSLLRLPGLSSSRGSIPACDLRQAFPHRTLEFFGGVSVLLVGDFFQLPPVRQKPLYSTSTSLSSMERRGQAAYRLFDRTVFLTRVQRQAGDDQAGFRQALQELREVKLSIPSWNLLSNRVQAKLTQSEANSFRAALRVYSTKARVSEYNHEHMVHLNAPAIQVEARNQGNGAGQAPSDNAGNLSNKFPVAKGARVMLTTNLWQPAGLVNGAQGTVYDIAWNAGATPREDPPAAIMVDFDNYDGPSFLTTNEGRKIVPILPVTRDFLLRNETCARTQFPLIVSFAITVHKCQSLTKDQIVTDLAARDFQAGISYVAVSRVTSLQGLLLEAPFDRQSLYNHTPTDGL
ncbi:hypothetical protein HIM_11763 [Hirsutella minnesotensis 3608]|uniref:ATP-dependent DNA helicase n=1 Tax=Hirsutella minnesotensis 3608 TaxID=1043627 RepID=A0A0F7ZIS8_9HYPO|nr:hypothetical protein HIM_11763 [Hirsutella minnesotensis 3608]